jgi:putative flippase GtrA
MPFRAKRFSVDIKKQVSRFCQSGILALTTDIIVYFTALNFLPYSFSKGISFFCGTSVSYTANNFWTFERDTIDVNDLFRYFSLYGISLILNVYLNDLCLNLFQQPIVFSYAIAAVICIIFNFLGQKFWIYAPR